MRRHRVTGMALGCALLLAACQPAGSSDSGSGGSGGSGGVGGDGQDVCVIGFSPDRVGVSAGHGLVTGAAIVNCSAPTQIHVVVTVFYDSGNGVHQIAHAEFDGVTISQTVSTTPANCYEGRYYAAYTATARADGEVKNQHKVSDVTTLSAGDCHR